MEICDEKLIYFTIEVLGVLIQTTFTFCYPGPTDSVGQTIITG